MDPTTTMLLQLQRHGEGPGASARLLLPGLNNESTAIGAAGGGTVGSGSSAGGNETEMFDERFIEAVVRIVVPISFGIIGVLGLIGNSLVVVVVACNSNMRSTTNILIINLAVADLLFVIFCIPFTGTDFVLPYWPFGNVWCKCVQYLIIVTACASVYTLVLMSFDRYLAVVHPVNSRSLRTEGNAIVVICIIWILTLVLSIPVFLIHGEVPGESTGYEAAVNGSIVALSLNENRYVLRLTRNGSLAEDFLSDNEITPHRHQHQLQYHQLQQHQQQQQQLLHQQQQMVDQEQQEQSTCRILDERDWPIFQSSFFLVSYLVPLLLIGGLYMCMLNRLWQAPRISADGLRGRKRVTRLVAVVVGVFAFSWAPIQLVLVLKSLEVYPHNTWSIMFQIMAHVLAYANSCINPILYAFLSENFRKAFRKAVYCRQTTTHDHHNNIQTRTTRIPSSDQWVRLLRRGHHHQQPQQQQSPTTKPVCDV